ncbi:MAG: dienelactone hydrolase family protein, partial [Pseudomonadota bacterium]|nr:dienelactone hydrolase family protein [Pseudomonadota bacterium]
LFDRAKKGIELAYDETGMQEGIALKNQINWENALKDIQAGIEYFGTNNPVAVMGFCWGGTLAWLSATRLSVSGSICYYAGQLKNFLDETPRSPVLAHFGENDHSIPLTVPATLKERYPGVINHIYLDAGHGFNCNERESYNPKASKKAMQRSLGFLESIF